METNWNPPPFLVSMFGSEVKHFIAFLIQKAVGAKMDYVLRRDACEVKGEDDCLLMPEEMWLSPIQISWTKARRAPLWSTD